MSHKYKFKFLVATFFKVFLENINYNEIFNSIISKMSFQLVINMRIITETTYILFLVLSLQNLLSFFTYSPFPQTSHILSAQLPWWLEVAILESVVWGKIYVSKELSPLKHTICILKDIIQANLDPSFNFLSLVPMMAKGIFWF